MAICTPNYDQSILGIASSILKHYGAPCNHPSLSTVDQALTGGYRNVVLMVFDGLGASTLHSHLGPESFLRQRTTAVISSVFPPTTTAATVSIQTGLSPIEHAWLGWRLFFPEIGQNVQLFPNTTEEGSPAAAYHVANRYLAYTANVEQIQRATQGRVQAERVSPFPPYQCQSLPELMQTCKSICNQPGEHFIYAYWPQPDYSMHDLGTQSPQVAALIRQINIAAQALAHYLRETLVIITADHGLIDTKYTPLAMYPRIMQTLHRPPSMESRALAFAIKPGEDQAFCQEFQEAFDGQYLLLSRDEVLREGFLGPGRPHPRALEFLGDYLAIALGDLSIQPPASPVFRAAHAGLTKEEMLVPLILIPCQ